MRAIHIDSTNKTIKEIELSNNSDMRYREIRDLVGGCLAIAFYYPGDKNLCYVNDDGLLNNPQCFFKSDLYPNPLAGSGVIVGNSVAGNTVACRLKIDDVIKQTKFLSLVEVQEMIRNGEADFNSYFMASDGRMEIISIIDLGAFNETKK